MKIIFEPLKDGVEPPKRSHLNDAGLDCKMPEDTLIKHGMNLIPMGFKMIIPDGYCALLTPRSSFMSKLVNSAVPIDAQYAGEVHLCVNNMGEDFVVKKGERIAQLMFLPVPEVNFVTPEEYKALSRGDGGLGSTGK